MPKPRVLVSGASVAGPALAYWLIRAGCEVTIVERAVTLRTAGQGVDVRDSARDVIRKMKIFDTMRAKSSQEQGIHVVNSNNKTLASFPADLESGDGNSFSCDIEILRGELGGILYDVTKDDVEYIFGDYVQSLEETEKDVRVTFTNGAPSRTFDLVVAADGIGSKIRNMITGKSYTESVRSLHSYVAYFSLPPGPGDSTWARVCWVVGGRGMSLRPDHIGRSRAFLTLVAYSENDPRLPKCAKAASEGVAAQKALFQELFSGAGWESERMLKAMHGADDFYMQHIGQTRIPSWHSSGGRVALTGDAAYAPSPFTGMGTSLGFIGAYVLAGEISKQLDDIPDAVRSYDKVLRPYVESVQKLPPGIPWIVNPQSSWGLRILENVVWSVGFFPGSKLSALAFKLFEYVPTGLFGSEWKLPEYEAFLEKE